MSADSSRAPLVFGVVFFSLIATVIAHVIGGSNPYTPAGSEGYVFHQPLVIGQREFIEVQRGPTSTGWRWAQQVINLDMRVATYTEQMQIFSLDQIAGTQCRGSLQNILQFANIPRKAIKLQRLQGSCRQTRALAAE